MCAGTFRITNIRWVKNGNMEREASVRYAAIQPNDLVIVNNLSKLIASQRTVCKYVSEKLVKNKSKP